MDAECRGTVTVTAGVIGRHTTPRNVIIELDLADWKKITALCSLPELFPDISCGMGHSAACPVSCVQCVYYMGVAGFNVHCFMCIAGTR